MVNSLTPTSTTAKLVYFVPPSGGVNFEREEKLIVIANMRGKDDTLITDTAGFQFYQHKSKYTSFTNDDVIRPEYYPESIELIKKLTGASRVELFDHTIRRRLPGDTEESPEKRQSAVQLLEERFQIIHLWRPIVNPVLDWPLALCDYRSVDLDNDTVPLSLIYPDHEGETLAVKYNSNYQWKYLYGMTPEEIVLIKCFDSIQDGNVAVYTPHTAFEDPITPAGTPRQSIELRALVFYN